MSRLLAPLRLLVFLSSLLATFSDATETKHCIRIDQIPYRITAPGLYCLTGDHAVASSPSTPKNAIQIEASNVMLDCNHHLLTGSGAGAGAGVMTVVGPPPRNAGLSNIVVRNCRLHGFSPGISMMAHGYLIERNDLSANVSTGIRASWGGGMVRRNRVVDTRGWAGLSYSVSGISITGDADVVDNLVDRVTAAPGSDDAAYGIAIHANGGTIAGNRIRHVTKDGLGGAYGIYVASPDRVSVDENRISNPANGVAAVYCEDGEPGIGSAPGIASGNHSNGFLGGVVGCIDGGANVAR